jgi:hypothetical protein
VVVARIRSGLAGFGGSLLLVAVFVVPQPTKENTISRVISVDMILNSFLFTMKFASHNYNFLL